MVAVSVARCRNDRSRKVYLELVRHDDRKNLHQCISQTLHGWLIELLWIASGFPVSNEYLKDNGNIQPPVISLAKSLVDGRVWKGNDDKLSQLLVSGIGTFLQERRLRMPLI